MLRAVGYSTITTIGPTVIIILSLVVANIMMSVWNVGEAEKLVFSGVVLYCFIGGLVVSSMFDTVISRYISDCIFQERFEKLLPAAQGSFGMFTGIFAVLGGVFAALLYFLGGLDLYYVLMVYLLLMGVGLTFGVSIFVMAIKAYKRIALSYLIGACVIALITLVLRLLMHLPVGHSLLTGYAAGFLVIAFLLFVTVRRTFPRGDKSYFQFLKSAGKNKLLLLSGFFYALGLIAHNVIFWIQSDIKVVVVQVLHSAPSYDMATLLAMVTNLSAVVIFVVRVETKFYGEYKRYCESVIGDTAYNIGIAREKMLRVLNNEMFFIFEFQLILTIILMSLALALLPLIGIAGITLDIYPVLALGYYAVFMMHCIMIFLYYFNDHLGAAITGGIFFVVTTLGTIISLQLGLPYYGVGLLAGGVISWLFSFLRLKWMMNRVDYVMFCDSAQTRGQDVLS